MHDFHPDIQHEEVITLSNNRYKVGDELDRAEDVTECAPAGNFDQPRYLLMFED